MIGYCKVLYETVDSFEQYERRAIELVKEGYTEVLPSDEPKNLLQGYIFDSPNNLHGYVDLKIRIYKDGIPRQNFKGDRVALARSWGSTL